MFFIREVSGQITPYSPGAIRRKRSVDPLGVVAPVSSQSEVRSLAEPRKSTSENLPHNGVGVEVLGVIAAYERALHRDTPRRRLLLASELMTKNIVTISQSSHLRDAHKLFAEKRFRHIPVMDDKAKLVGMLSDRDLLRRAAHIDESTGAEESPWQNTLVSTIMSHPVLVASGDTEIREVANVMFQERIGCIPIVDDSHQVVGIITRGDILKTLVMQAPLELWR